MIYRAARGSMWDPSVIWHDGIYHAFMMYNKEGPNGLEARHCLRASSLDGVHWNDEVVLMAEREHEKGNKFFKCFVGRCGDRFIMNHGVSRTDGQDTLRFYESKDLRNWDYLFSSHPDAQWYNTSGRWDHMYILPKREGDATGGYWGYLVATTRPGMERACGMAETADGRKWTVIQPAQFEWGDVPSVELEIGGVERIGDRYVMIGGCANYLGDGYSMYTLIASDPCGPFRPDKEAYRLCGTSTRAAGWGVSFLAAWCRGREGEKLVSNYVSVPSGTWMLPMRRAVLDDGHLRLGWWPENDVIKGNARFLTARQTVTNGRTWIEHHFDLGRGVVLEGKLRGIPLGENAAAGFAFAEANGCVMEIRLGINDPGKRETLIGRHRLVTGFCVEDTVGQGCATATGINPGTIHKFRLLLRHDIFELYIDDLLVQTYVYRPSNASVGLVAYQSEAIFEELTAYEMTL